MTFLEPGQREIPNVSGKIFLLKIYFDKHPTHYTAILTFERPNGVKDLQHLRILPPEGVIEVITVEPRTKLYIEIKGSVQKHNFFAWVQTLPVPLDYDPDKSHFTDVKHGEIF